MKKNTHFQWDILKFPQMENLIFEQKNKLIARGLQLVALGDMLNSYGEFYIVAPLTGQCQIAHRIRSTL
jgi:hypothetical protein